MTKFKSDYEVGQKVVIVEYEESWGGYDKWTVHTLTGQYSRGCDARFGVWELDNHYIHPEKHFVLVTSLLPTEDFL